MRLSRTFGLGAALAVLPLVAGMTFVVNQLQVLAAHSERRMLHQLTAVKLGTEIGTRLDRLAEYQRKFQVSGDRGYANKAEDVARAIDAQLAKIAQADPPSRADSHLAAFIGRWHRFRQAGVVPKPPPAVLLVVAPPSVDELAADVRAMLERAHDAAVEDIAQASRTRAAAMRAAVIATIIALLSSATLLVLLVRRVRRRLDDFVEATVTVSRGAFSAKLSFGGDDELGRVATAFNQMVSALDELERIKSDFLSSISHELRTPLVAMVETNEALLDGVAGPLADPQRRMITLNAGAARRLSTMIGDLLELSALRSSLRYRMEPVRIGSVVVDAVSEMAARAKERGLELRVQVEDDAALVADRDRLMQVVQNLVDNAIKHTPSEGLIEVSVRGVDRDALGSPPLRASPEDRRFALVRVADSGPGIPPADRERVFEKFFRRQGVSADGVGLGLAICREIAHAHRGGIWIEDGQLGGASVCVALPVERA